MPASPAVLNTLQTLVAGPPNPATGASEPTSFSIGFLAALGAKELSDQQAGADRQASKAAKTQASPTELGQGQLGQTDQLVTLARFAQSGLLPALMSGGPSPLMPPPSGPMVGPPSPGMGPAGPPMGAAPLAGPMPPPGAPGLPPPGMPMAGPPPGMPPGAPGGQIPPAILMALQQLIRPSAGVV